jgi:drug/metabolite transporter (DMT)-like permease
MEHAAWLWIPITLWAALAQTLRNATQRHLTTELGTLGATLVRFLYGLPFAFTWLAIVLTWRGEPLPTPTAAFYGWVTLGAVSQIAATAFLLRVMQERNFALGVAYSKTELIQIAIFGLLVLGDPVSAATALAIAFGTIGVLLLSPADKQHPLRALVTGWATPSARIGLASGACFALSVIGYRGAALSLGGGTSFLLAGAFGLVVAQLIQTALLGGWLAWRAPQVVKKTLTLWRPSLFAGFMGAAASAGWFTAFAIEPAAHVRTLALIELLFSYVVSRKIFREKLTPLELAGIGLLTVGLVVVTLGR